MFTPAKYFLPAAMGAVLAAVFWTAPALAEAAAWQVQQANMTYQNSGLENPQGVLSGTEAQIGFDPKKPRGGQFQLSFATTGLFLPRAAMGVSDPQKLKNMAIPAGTGTLTATSLERSGNTIAVNGTLSINGQSRPLMFNMNVIEDGKDNARSLRLTGQFPINRPSFATAEMGYVGPANIPVSFDVLAVAPTAAAAEEAPTAAGTTEDLPVDAAAPQMQNNEIPQQRIAAPPPQAPSRLLTEEDLKKQREEHPEIGTVRSFGGNAAPPPAQGRPRPSATAPAQNNTTDPEIGTVRTFGGAP